MNMQGDDQLRERRRHQLRQEEPTGIPANVMGLDGHQGVRLQQRRPAGHLRHRHALGHERADGARARQSQVHDEVARVVSRHGQDEHLGQPFFLKEGPSKFREASDALGLESYCPWGPSVGDLNADGFDDTFIAAGMNYPERYMINSVKLNDAGKRFVDAEFVLGVEPRSGGVATPFFELDASGKDKGHTDAAGATGRVTVWGARGTRSAVIFDVDGDGDLDIVTNEFNAPPMVSSVICRRRRGFAISRSRSLEPRRIATGSARSSR